MNYKSNLGIIINSYIENQYIIHTIIIFVLYGTTRAICMTYGYDCIL